jgi:cytochrome c
MKKTLKLLGSVTLCVAASSAFAGVNQTDANNLTAYVRSEGLSCMSCHSVTSKRVGPAWLDVAKKYHSDPKAQAMLTTRITNGGSGVWGSIPMPPGMANQAQAKKLAEMILHLYKP